MVCERCGNERWDNAPFCPYCGQRHTIGIPSGGGGGLTMPSPPGKRAVPFRKVGIAQTEALRSCIGRNAEYYLKEFEKLSRGEKSVNYMVFFFGIIILLYRRQFVFWRKMYSDHAGRPLGQGLHHRHDHDNHG